MSAIDRAADAPAGEKPVIDFGAAVAGVVPFVAHLGLTVDASTVAQRVGLPEDGRLDNHVGSRHAGALFTTAETASGMAILALLTRTGTDAVPLVAEASIRYSTPAHGVITALPTLLRDDGDVIDDLTQQRRARVGVHVELRDDTDRVVATAAFEWALKARATRD